MFSVKKFTVLFMVLVFAAISACASYQYEGGAAGGVLGGIAGALLDHKNPWRGGVIGAGLGAAAGATISEISVRGARESAATGKPVEYRTEDGRGVYRAEPVSDSYYRPNENTKCRKVQERTWEDGRMVKDQVKEICEGEKTEHRY